MANRTAALVGTNNPHSLGWLTALRSCPLFSRVVVYSEESVDVEADAVYKDINGLVMEERLSMAVVCSRNDVAPRLAARLVRAGVPIILEKPVARNTAEIARIMRIARKNKVICTVAFQNRFQPLAVELRNLVQARALGRIVSIEANMVTNTVRQRNPKHWLFDEEIAGGGILHWLACHTIDLIRYLTGQEFQSVMAKVGTLGGEAISVEDVAAMVFQMSDGAIGSLHAGYVLRSRYGDIGLKIRGTLGEAVWPMFGIDGRMNTLYVRSDAPAYATAQKRDITMPFREEPPGYGGALTQALIGNVIDAVERRGHLVVRCEDAYRAMQVIQAAYRSSETGREIKIRT